MDRNTEIREKGLVSNNAFATCSIGMWIAETLLKRYKLEGFLLIKSSDKNYHVVFNKYLRWKTITKRLFNLYECVRWAVFQMKEGQLTLRICKKNNRDKPKILLKVGKTDKLIKDYFEIYEKFKDF